MMLFSYAYFTYLRPFPMFIGQLDVLSQDSVQPRSSPKEMSEAGVNDHPCAGPTLVLPSEILLLTSTLTCLAGFFISLTGWPHLPLKINTLNGNFLLSLKSMFFSFYSCVLAIWPIIFILTVPVKVRVTISCGSRNLHGLFPFPTPYPSCPVTSFQISACNPLPLGDVFPRCPSSSSSFPWGHWQHGGVITSVIAWISGSDIFCFAYSAGLSGFLGL